MDAQPPLILMRLTDGQAPPMGLSDMVMAVNIEDTLAQCAFCRADGWLGRGQVPMTGTRLCLNCYATAVAMGLLPLPTESKATIVIADKRVPKRPQPRPRQ